RIAETAPRTAVQVGGAEFLARHLVTPLAERAFGELHDVALVHQRHRYAVVVNRVADRLAHQTLRTLLGYRLDADPGAIGKADAGDAHLPLQEINHPLYIVRAGRPLDTGVNVLGVFAENHHIGQLRRFQWRHHARKILNGPDTGVQIQRLADGHIQGTDAAAGRR